MSRPIDHPGFRNLKQKWDRILAETGFNDCEDKEGRLKQTSGGIYARYRCSAPVQREARVQFYTRLSELVQRTKFPNTLERIVMAGLAEGLTQVEIRERLGAMGMGVHKCTTIRIIKRWLKRWNLR